MQDVQHVVHFPAVATADLVELTIPEAAQGQLVLSVESFALSVSVLLPSSCLHVLRSGVSRLIF